MNTLTTLQIRDAFAAAIVAIVPTFEPLRAIGWAYTPGARKNGQAVLPQSTRAFDLVFSAGVPSYLWTGGSGVAYTCRIAIATSYAGVEPDLLEHLWTADAVDLRRALAQLRDPTLPGLADVIARGIANESFDSEANARCDHTFELHYHQSTD